MKLPRGTTKIKQTGALCNFLSVKTTLCGSDRCICGGGWLNLSKPLSWREEQVQALCPGVGAGVLPGDGKTTASARVLWDRTFLVGLIYRTASASLWMVNAERVSMATLILPP